MPPQSRIYSVHKVGPSQWRYYVLEANAAESSWTLVHNFVGNAFQVAADCELHSFIDGSHPLA